MRKKLQFCISLLLILTICLSVFIVPASSYQNDISVSSNLVLMMNLDTETPVYTKSASKKWHSGYLSELMTFIITTQNVADPEKETVKIQKSFFEKLDYSDGCLKKFYGKELTVKDLLAFTLLTSGSDAANVLAHYVSGGDIKKFVTMMNKKAKELTCKSTNFISPGFDITYSQLTSCHDLMKIYSYLSRVDLFKELSEKATYVPAGFEAESYMISTNSSIRTYGSPYYFRYVDFAKYSYSRKTGEAMIATTTYRGKRYLFVALRGKKTSEENVYVDCKRLATWAYLNLSDKKLLSFDMSVGTVSIESRWDMGDIDLVVAGTQYKTVPNDYEVNDFNTIVDVPESVKLPVFAGQNIGTAKIYYEDELVDEVSVVASTSAGVSLVEDLRAYLSAAASSVMPDRVKEEPENEEEETTISNAGDFDLS